MSPKHLSVNQNVRVISSGKSGIVKLGPDTNGKYEVHFRSPWVGYYTADQLELCEGE